MMSKSAAQSAAAVGTQIASASRVRSLYRRILRSARTWEGLEERNYVRNEAHTLFHKNAGLTRPSEIQEKLFEGESRLELALHYRIPYPRPYNVTPGSTGRPVRPSTAPSKSSVLDSDTAALQMEDSANDVQANWGKRKAIRITGMKIPRMHDSDE
mmetsp:Transcript_11406/g.23127  ORF Transcript_11406/g.23127 Transcript_11406/m.23127 type:complete len:156 (-) Transcript_11406:1222-1689(-)